MPEVAIDSALSRNLIDPAIPDIRKKSVEVLRAVYTSQEQAVNGIAGLEGYYQVAYPEYYASNQASIQTAVNVLQDIYAQSVYIDQKSDWNTHPNNIGHKDSPGCFRCHDGKHLDSQQQAVRLECNLCHSIPAVSDVRKLVTEIEINRGLEPQSHLNANWIALHNQAFNDSCSNCHATANPGGVDNSSFCSNSACHGTKWAFAGFDAPTLRQTLLAQLPPTPTPEPLPTGGPLTYNDTIGPLLTSRCGSCHGSSGILGLNLTTYQSALTGSQNGPVIVAGDPNASSLVQKQSGVQAHFGQLTPDELALIIEWIKAGAPEK
jgi:hypothetical protein